MAKTVKIYGERNSGTNYLSLLLQENLCVHILRGIAPHWLGLAQRVIAAPDIADIFFSLTTPKNLGWKHSIPFFLEAHAPLRGDFIRNVLFVTVTKNPYSWLLSLYKRPHHLKGLRQDSFESFLKQPWATARRENAPPEFVSPVDIWNSKNGAYLSMCDNGFSVANIRYEDLIADPQQTIWSLAEKFRLEHNPLFRNIVESTKGEELGFSDYQRYYLTEAWRNKLSDEAIALINARLDKDVVSRFGYPLIT